jgi:hypothetical protein
MGSSVRCAILALGVVLGGIGCSDPRLADTAYLSGTVTFQGQPFSGGEVQIFSPQVGVGASASIDASGNFKIPRPVRPGSYEVALRAVPPPPPLPDPNYRPPFEPSSRPIPAKYQDASTSGLRVEMNPGENTLNIDLVP